LPTLLLLENGHDLRFAESTLFHKGELKVRKLRLSLLSIGLLSGEAYKGSKLAGSAWTCGPTTYT
ncbi:MAG TPA: hypothetical protein VF629_22505, partial [Hymenobacter sp.]|uniref:hypothetical protein n=1 Tax=Hymenobacter sp. TaxID=1898978 RepID=UPI002ED9DDDD